MANDKRIEDPEAPTSAGAPSAPPIVQSERQTTSEENGGGASYPRLTQNAGNAGEGRRFEGQNPSPYDEPPPTYHAAMGYPTTPYPSGGMPNLPQPAYYPPKPNPQYPVHNQPPIYHAIHTAGGTQPSQPMSGTTQVIVAVSNGFTCPHCNAGIVTRETDMCCMLCLILLTIFTFPFGLVFLCCLPCAVTRRCSNCNRTM